MSSRSDNDGRRPDGTLDIDKRAIDARLMDNLIARHGEPPRARPLSAAEREMRERIAKRDALLAAADADLIHHIERHDRSARTIDEQLGTDTEIASASRRELARFDLAAWRLMPAAEPREVEPSPDVLEALDQRTPQAILRDLHRPVLTVGDIQLVPTRVPTGYGQLAAVQRAIRAALGQRMSGAADIEIASRQGFRATAELAEILAQPWEDSRPDNPLPMARRAPPAEDWQWFGLDGGFDPDA